MESAEEPAKASESQHLLEVSDLVDPRQLAKYLIEADVGLVRAQYLWRLHEEGGSLPRRQELDGVRFPLAGRERDCLVAPDELRHWAEDDSPQRPRIFAISHCWESREHPDPCGYQLSLIHDYTRKYDHAFDCEMWLFYDYSSLCQYQRNDQQEQSFRRAMRQMHLLYAHNSTTTLRIETLTPEPLLQRCRSEGRQIWAHVAGQLQLVSLKDLRFEDDHPDVVPCFNPQCPYLHGYAIPYRQRGWCEAEAQWSAMRGRSHSSIRIDVDMEGAGRSYQVKAPMPPELFRQRIFSNEGLKFTWRSDLMQVVALQEEVFREKAKSCEELLQKGLPDEEFMTLAVALRCFTKLRVLHLRKCQIREQGSTALAQGLQTLSAKNAKIICSDIDGLSFLVKALSQALRSNRSVTSLDLSAQSFSHRTAEKMGDADAKELAEALKFGAIVELNLAGNEIGPEGTKAIAGALKTPSCAVLDLNLEGNHMGPEGAEALLEALEVNRSVTNIGYAGNGLEVQHMEAFREALERNRAMRATNDGKALLGSQSAIGLGNGLSSAGAVLKAPLKRSLSTSSKVRPKIQAMSESLRMNGTSTHLHLKGAMDDAAAKALAASLAVNSTVTHVDWAGSKIGDDGAQALASAMMVNRTVVFIDLSGNQIGDLGAKAFAKALRENSTIQQINLKNNKIGPKGRKALQVLHLEPTEPRALV